MLYTIFKPPISAFQNVKIFCNRSDGSKVMTINVKGGMSAGTRFAYAILLAKRAKNGHFRPKNASIDLQIGHILYLGGFYDFSNFQRNRINRSKIGAKSE